MKITSEGLYRGSGGSGDLETGYGFIIDRDPKALFYFQVGVREIKNNNCTAYYQRM